VEIDILIVGSGIDENRDAVSGDVDGLLDAVERMLAVPFSCGSLIVRSPGPGSSGPLSST